MNPKTKELIKNYGVICIMISLLVCIIFCVWISVKYEWFVSDPCNFNLPMEQIDCRIRRQKMKKNHKLQKNINERINYEQYK